MDLLQKFWKVGVWLAAKFVSAATWLVPHERGSVPAYFSMYVAVLVVSYAVCKGRRDATVISPFSFPTEAKLPFSEYAVANAMRDALLKIQREAERGVRSRATVLTGVGTAELKDLKLPELSGFEVPARFAVEVKGLSLEAVISVARKVFGRERIISGDVLTEGNSFSLLARSQQAGPWNIGPQPATPAGLQLAVDGLALKVIEHFHPTLLAAYEIAQGKYQESLDRLTKLVQNA